MINTRAFTDKFIKNSPTHIQWHTHSCDLSYGQV